MEAKFKKYQMITPISGRNTTIPQGRYLVCSGNYHEDSLLPFGPSCRLINADDYRLVTYEDRLETLTNAEITSAAFRNIDFETSDATKAKVISEYRELEKKAIRPEFIPRFRKGDKVEPKDGRGKVMTCKRDSWLEGRREYVKLIGREADGFCSDWVKIVQPHVLGENESMAGETVQPALVVSDELRQKNLTEPAFMPKLKPLDDWYDGNCVCHATQTNFDIKPEISGEQTFYNLYADGEIIQPRLLIYEAAKAYAEAHRNHEIRKHFEF